MAETPISFQKTFAELEARYHRVEELAASEKITPEEATERKRSELNSIFRTQCALTNTFPASDLYSPPTGLSNDTALACVDYYYSATAFADTAAETDKLARKAQKPVPESTVRSRLKQCGWESPSPTFFVTSDDQALRKNVFAYRKGPATEGHACFAKANEKTPAALVSECDFSVADTQIDLADKLRVTRDDDFNGAVKTAIINCGLIQKARPYGNTDASWDVYTCAREDTRNRIALELCLADVVSKNPLVIKAQTIGRQQRTNEELRQQIEALQQKQPQNPEQPVAPEKTPDVVTAPDVPAPDVVTDTTASDVPGTDVPGTRRWRVEASGSFSSGPNSFAAPEADGHQIYHQIWGSSLIVGLVLPTPTTLRGFVGVGFASEHGTPNAGAERESADFHILSGVIAAGLYWGEIPVVGGDEITFGLQYEQRIGGLLAHGPIDTGLAGDPTTSDETSVMIGGRILLAVTYLFPVSEETRMFVTGSTGLNWHMLPNVDLTIPGGWENFKLGVGYEW